MKRKKHLKRERFIKKTDISRSKHLFGKLKIHNRIYVRKDKSYIKNESFIYMSFFDVLF